MDLKLNQMSHVGHEIIHLGECMQWFIQSYLEFTAQAKYDLFDQAKAKVPSTNTQYGHWVSREDEGQRLKLGLPHMSGGWARWGLEPCVENVLKKTNQNADLSPNLTLVGQTN